MDRSSCSRIAMGWQCVIMIVGLSVAGVWSAWAQNGACCFDDGSCFEMNAATCSAATGTFWGEGTTCLLDCPGRINSAFTYQGQVLLGVLPVNGSADLDFMLWDAGTSGTIVAPVVSHSDIQVVNGVFSVILDFGPQVFNGDKRWLEIHVRSPHDPTNTAPFTALSPRQLLTVVPTALTLPAVRVIDHSISPNVIGGYKLNSVKDGIYGATISGGGEIDLPNAIYHSFGTIGGGKSNIAGDPHDDQTDLTFATIGGGSFNFAQGKDSTIGGGSLNRAAGRGSTVPGGTINQAGGDYSFAAGKGAYVRHAGESGNAEGDEGTFVWSDSSEIFTSTGPYQFLVRATGGAGFGTNAPLGGLHVKREPNSSGGTFVLEGTTHTFMTFYPNGSVVGRKAYIGFAGANATAMSIANENEDGDILLLTGSPTGQIGINVYDPQFALELPNNGDAAIGKGRANAWETYSSIRWKENIRAIADPLGKVMRLNGVSFDWKPEHGGTPDIGFVAEEVGEVVPEIVTWEEDGEFALGLNYDRISALAVEAIKVQQQQIEELRAENAALTTNQAELQSRLQRLEQQFAAMTNNK